MSLIMYWLGLLKTCFSKAFMQVMSDAPTRLTDSQFFAWRLFLRWQMLCFFLVLLHTSAGYIHTISGGHWVQGVQLHVVCGTVIMHRAGQEYKTEFLDVSHHFESSFRAGKRRRKSVWSKFFGCWSLRELLWGRVRGHSVTFTPFSYLLSTWIQVCFMHIFFPNVCEGLCNEILLLGTCSEIWPVVVWLCLWKLHLRLLRRCIYRLFGLSTCLFKQYKNCISADKRFSAFVWCPKRRRLNDFTVTWAILT